MAFTATEYRKAWSSETFGEIRRKSLMFGLTDRRYTEAWVRGDNTVYIPIPTWGVSGNTGVEAQDVGRGSAWSAARDVAQDQESFTRSGTIEIANDVLWEDALELNWPVVEEMRSRQAYAMSLRLDDKIYDAAVTAIQGETSTPNFTALGSNTNSINRSTGKAATSAAAGLVYEAIDEFSLKLANSDVDPGDGDSVGAKYMIMRPTLFRILENWLLDKGYSFDPLTADVLQRGTIFAGSAFEGRLKGVDLYSWTGSPMPSGADSNTAANIDHNWQILCGVRSAIIANTRPPLVQYFTPDENQNGTEHLLRQRFEWGVKVMETNWLHLFGIDGGADS